MIARHLPIKNSSKSSAKCLVSYLMDRQGNGQRVLDYRVTNCLGLDPHGDAPFTEEDVHLAAQEMIAVQCMNTSASSAKMYHLLVSFKEAPDKATMEAIEDELCTALGFKEFQRISVLHGDTDNLHLHIAINKIHPETYHIHNPYRDYRVLANVSQKLEKKYGVQVDNHETRTTARPSRSAAMEKAGDMESLIGWMQRNCKEALKSAASWEEFHTILSSQNLKIQERGNGFIFTNGEVCVKASSVDRAFSKHRLEAQLGKFVNIEKQVPVRKQYKLRPMQYGHYTDHMYKRYQQERKEAASVRKKELNELFLKEQTEIKELFDKSVGDQIASMIRHTFWRKILRFIKQQEQLARLKAIKQRHLEAEAEIQKRYEQFSWRKWLENEAKNGNQEALDIMYARGSVNTARNTIQADSPTSSRDIVKVTRKGTRLFSDGTRERLGLWMFRKVPPLDLQQQAEFKEQLRAFFAKNLDKKLYVTGEKAFEDAVIDVAGKLKTPPRFEQPELSRRLNKNQHQQRVQSSYRGR